MKNTSGEVYTL